MLQLGQLEVQFIHAPGEFLDLSPGADGADDQPDADAKGHTQDEQDDWDYQIFHNQVPSDWPR